MKLFGTVASHFTRKIRIILDEAGLQPGKDYEFCPLTEVWATGATNFGNNPLHRFPVLHDGDLQLFESDLIAEYLFEKYWQRPLLPEYSGQASTTKWHDKRRLAVINGAMVATVRYLRAERTGVPEPVQYAAFAKDLNIIKESLQWLDTDLQNLGDDSYRGDNFTYLDISLICFVEHAIFRGFIEKLDEFESVKRHLEKWQKRPSVAMTHPEAGI